MKAIAYIMFGKFRGMSTEDYLLKESATAVDLLYPFFMSRTVDSSVYLPDGQSKPEMFAFVISSIDNYFYSLSNARKRARICRKVEGLTELEVARTASTGLPSMNFVGEFSWV